VRLGRPRDGSLRSQTVATTLPADLTLSPLGSEPRDLEAWLTTFHLASVVLDPYTNESSWVLKSAVRILEGFRGSDARVNFVVTAEAADARQFLGPLVDEFQVFCDPGRTFVKAVGLQRLPAFVFVRVDREVAGVAEGWNPAAWREVAHLIADATAWTAPMIPGAGDPSAFAGSAANG
jgi:hypothetical protein